jgi:nucleoside-diphosphate-sugar epimerase
MSGRVLVTGATGMLGSSVVDAFREAGWDVRALVRDPERAGWLADLGVGLAPGDLVDAASIRSAARGCDVVVHAAAAIGAGSDMEAFEKVNVVGTQAVVAAAYRAGARLVHMSSTAVYSDRSRSRAIVDEGTPFGTLEPTDAYGRSKQMAERVVETACRTGAMWATVIRPTMMYGLRDRQFVPRIAPVLKRGFMPLIDGGETRMTIVAARSVAEVALLAATSDVACGRAYVVAEDVPTKVRTVIEAASAGLARPIRSPHVPTWVGRGAFALLHGWLRLTRRPDLARRTSGTFRGLVRDNPFTSDRARRELGWRPSVDPGAELERAFRRWAREEDRVRRGELEGETS